MIYDFTLVVTWLVGQTQINILMLTIKDNFSESVQILIYFYLLKQILFPLWIQKAIQIHIFRNGSNITDADKKIWRIDY